MNIFSVFARPVPQGCNGALPRAMPHPIQRGLLELTGFAGLALVLCHNAGCRDDAARQAWPATYAKRLRRSQNEPPIIAGRY